MTVFVLTWRLIYIAKVNQDRKNFMITAKPVLIFKVC